MFRGALLCRGFCRRKYKAGSLGRMSVPLRMANLSDAALESQDFKQDILQPKPTRSRGTQKKGLPMEALPQNAIAYGCQPDTHTLLALAGRCQARASFHLRPRPFPLVSLDIASLLEIAGFRLNIASAPPRLLYSIPEFTGVLLILHMALRFPDQRAEESIAFQSGVAESTVPQMMTMQQTISRGPGMAPVKAPNTTAQAE